MGGASFETSNGSIVLLAVISRSAGARSLPNSLARDRDLTFEGANGTYQTLGFSDPASFVGLASRPGWRKLFLNPSVHSRHRDRFGRPVVGFAPLHAALPLGYVVRNLVPTFPHGLHPRGTRAGTVQHSKPGSALGAGTISNCVLLLQPAWRDAALPNHLSPHCSWAPWCWLNTRGANCSPPHGTLSLRPVSLGPQSLSWWLATATAPPR